MEKIGIFGGTFNPIHNGHIALCNACNEYFGFDKLFLIPSNVPPHKTVPNLASNIDRFNMVSIAAKKVKNAVVSDIEFILGEKSYTIFTLEEIKKLYPSAELFLIIGSDMLLSFHTWYRYEDILRLATLVAGGRAENITDKMKAYASSLMATSVEFENKVKVIEIPINILSSTQIRESIKEGRGVEKLLSPEVFEYIRDNSLYI